MRRPIPRDLQWLLLAFLGAQLGCSGEILGDEGPDTNGADPENATGNAGASQRGSAAAPGAGLGSGTGSTPGMMGSGNGGAGGGGTSGSTTGGSGHGDEDPGMTPDGVPLGTRLVRLTHEQYDNTISDLFSIDVKPSAAFIEDPTFAGYDNNAEGLNVSGRLGRDYRRTAEELAAMVVSVPDVYSAVVPCAGSDASCAERFVSEFGARAFRRPLTNEEKQAYLGLHARGGELVASGNAFRDGVQVAVEAFLQSPHFIYRVELSTETNDDDFIPLDDYEMASRLSYTLWNSMPDAELFRAAAAGELETPVGVREQAARMLDMPAARRVVEDFHYQWLDLDHYRDLTKSSTLYPEFSSDLTAPLQEEALKFVDHVVFDLDESFGTLFRAPFTFVNDTLANLYGLSGNFTDQFVKVDLNANERGGLLTQIGFLASHAYSTNTSPIHRGVFVLRRIVCKPPPDPPPNVDFNLPPIEGDIKTTRQQVTAHTSPEACTPCHGVINPIGFGFEQFDSIGRFRTTENGEPVDASGTINLDGQSHSFQSTTELLDAIVASEDARECYAKNWLRYAYGREDQVSDAATLGAITVAIGDPSYSVKDLILDLTQTKSFRFRAPNTVFEP